LQQVHEAINLVIPIRISIKHGEHLDSWNIYPGESYGRTIIGLSHKKKLKCRKTLAA
jgi:hypothetical protein